MIDTRATLDSLLARRVLVLDGAMGTMVQRHSLTDADYRGTRFADHGHDLKGDTDVLSRARALAARRGVTNVSWEVGEIERLPLADASVDVVLLSQALHHAETPARALAEAHRVVTPGGRILILDLRAHDQAWVRDRLNDRWLGFDDRALAGLVAAAGFTDVRTATGASLADGPFAVVLATGKRS